MTALKRRNLLLGAGALLILAGVMALARAWQVTFPTVPVLKATRDLPAGVAVSADAIAVHQVPVGARPEGALSHLQHVKDKWTQAPIFAGEFITSRRVDSQPPDPAEDLGNGVGLMSLPVNPAHVLGGNLRPGDQVTIYAVPKPEREGARTEATMAADKVMVVDVRNSGAGPTYQDKESGGLGAINTTSGQAPAWVVLRVAPAEAERLMEAVESKAAIYFFLTARGAPR